MDRGVLEQLVGEGASIRRIAETTGASYATVRLRLAAHGLQTVRTRCLEATRAAREAGLVTVVAECPVHGSVTMLPRGGGTYRCLRCRSDAVVLRRRRVKAILVAEGGGACRLCGFDRHLAALHFHHLDPGLKHFSLSAHGMSRSLDRARAEAAKCMLLCANCHAAVEAGMLQLPLPPTDSVSVADPG